MISGNADINRAAHVPESCNIEDGAFIGKECVLGENVSVGRNAIIESFTEIGSNTVLSPNAHVGGKPQDIGFAEEETKLIIGKNCTIREFATIHRASAKEDWKTEVGDNCYIMASSHVGHDCKIGKNVVITSYVGLSGHVHVGDNVVFGGMSAVHQFVRVGRNAMVGGFSRIVKDVPPFCMASGAPAKVYGLNSTGLRRSGFSRKQLSELKTAVKVLLNKDLLVKDVVDELDKLTACREVNDFTEFIKNSKRGVLRL